MRFRRTWSLLVAVVMIVVASCGGADSKPAASFVSFDDPSGQRALSLPPTPPGSIGDSSSLPSTSGTAETDKLPDAVPVGPIAAGKPGGTFMPVGQQVVLAIDPVADGYVWGVPSSVEFDSFVALTVADDVLYGMWGACTEDRAARSVGVAAFDALTGALRWWTAPLFTGGQGVDSMMASVDDGIYVAIGATEDGVTAMVGIDTATGAQRWRIDRPLGLLALSGQPCGGSELHCRCHRFGRAW